MKISFKTANGKDRKTRITDYDIQHRFYPNVMEYIKEIAKYHFNPELVEQTENGIVAKEETVRMRYAYHAISNPFSDFLHIYVNNQYAGFILLGCKQECRDDSDLYIIETYIKPEFRQKGVMSYVIKELIKNGASNLGLKPAFNDCPTEPTFCMFILNGNEGAEIFWGKVFSEAGYEFIEVFDKYTDDFDKQYVLRKAN